VTLADVTEIAFRQIYRTRRRYTGPVIGGILGSAALILVISLGDRVEKAVGSNLAAMGSATLIKLNLNSHYPDCPLEDPRVFSDADLDAIKNVPGVKVVTPSVYSWWPAVLEFVAVYRDRKQREVKVAGVESSFFDMVAHLKIADGRKIENEDVQRMKHVCVIGKGLREWLLEFEEEPLGKMIDVGGMPFEVVGILGDPEDHSLDETVFVPITVARTRLARMREIRRLTVLPDGLDSVETVSDGVSELLRARKPSYDYQVLYDAERIRSCRNVLLTFKQFTYVAISMTLILSAIGIANVTLAMVRERTSEIGLRKALGAADEDIAAQFLIESVTVSLISALIGILIGTGVVLSVTTLVWNSGVGHRIYTVAALASVLTGLVSGILSGILPANVAGKMDPVVAMKSE
jgi:ABC-type antimicrobial peptide transport system permease subunit